MVQWEGFAIRLPHMHGALRSVRGLFVTYGQKYQRVGARGFNRIGDYNSRITLLMKSLPHTNGDTANMGSEAGKTAAFFDTLPCDSLTYRSSMRGKE